MSFYQFKSYFSFSKVNNDKIVKNNSFEYIDNNTEVKGELEQIIDCHNKVETIYKHSKNINGFIILNGKSINNSNWDIEINKNNTIEKKEITYNKFSYLFNSNILENGSYFNHHNFLELDI